MGKINWLEVKPNTTFQEILIYGFGAVLCMEVFMFVMFKFALARVSDNFAGSRPHRPSFVKNMSASLFQRAWKSSDDSSLQKFTDWESEVVDQYNAWKRLEKDFQARKNKFSETVVKILVRGFHTVYGWWVVMDLDCFWSDTAEPCVNPVISQPVKNYYFMIFGWYCYRALHQFVDAHVRSDFWAMFIHHWATLLLILGSWWGSKQYFGVLVAVCHDASDVFLPTAKLMSYLKLPTMKKIAFGVFTLSWFTLRLGLFPFFVIPRTWEANDPVGGKWGEGSPVYDWDQGHQFLTGCAIALVFVHVFWSVMIVRAFCKQLSGVAFEDPRSDADSRALPSNPSSAPQSPVGPVDYRKRKKVEPAGTIE